MKGVSLELVSAWVSAWGPAWRSDLLSFLRKVIALRMPDIRARWRWFAMIEY